MMVVLTVHQAPSDPSLHATPASTPCKDRVTLIRSNRGNTLPRLPGQSGSQSPDCQLSSPCSFQPPPPWLCPTCFFQASCLCSLSRAVHTAWGCRFWGFPALAPYPHPAPHSAPQVVFRYALAIFKYNEEALLRLQDSLEIYQYLHFFTKTICDSR